MSVIAPYSRLLWALVLVCLVVSSGAALSAKELSDSPMIARVTTYASAPPGTEVSGRMKVQESLAFVVEKDGHLLTSYRSLLDVDGYNLLQTIEVELKEGSVSHRYEASIVGVDPTINIAILKIQADHDLRVSRIAKRETIETAQTIHAVAGFDKGEPVLTHGKLTRLNSMECYQESMTSTMLEAEINIPDGVVGGPIFNDDGEVIAIHNGYVVPRGSENVDSTAGGRHILPIFLAFNIYESLKFKGSLKSPWTGFSVRPLTPDEAKIFPTPERFLGGIAIDYVWQDSPASKLGIRKGDILVGFSYYPTKSPAEFQKWLYWHGVGENVVLHFIRDRHQHLKLEYAIEERPSWAKPR